MLKSIRFEHEEPKGPSWRHRRRLIYATYVLAVVMIVFAMAVYRSDTSVASQLIVGAVSLISIILTAYTAFATLDDRWHYNSDIEMPTDWIDDEVR